MARTGKVAPIPKNYGDEVHTIDQQLAKNGYQRYPGTMEMVFPFKEKSGRTRTGLDVNAPYLNNLSEEDRVAEIARIERDKKRLEDELGVPGILNSNSLFYNFAASREALIKAHGTDLQLTPVKLGDKEEFFDLSNIMTEIAWNWLKVHPRIAPSLDAWNTGKVARDVKYYIVDDEAENKQIFNKKREINKAIINFDSLTPTKKKQIGRLMGLPITDTTEEETVYNIVDSALKETEFKSGRHKGFSPIRIFNELLKMSDDRLKVKDLIEQAVLHNVYRIVMGKVQEGGQTIAESPEALVEILLDEKHQQDLLILEKKLNGTKISKL